MRFRTWPVAALALGALLILIGWSVQESSRRAQDIYSRLDALNLRYHEVETVLRRLRNDVHLSGIFVRDYLLDSEAEAAPVYRARIVEFRRANLQAFEDLRRMIGGSQESDERLANLRTKLDEYWLALEPLFDWSPQDKLSLSAAFLRREVIPRREEVLSIARAIEEVNRSSLNTQRAAVAQQEEELRNALYRLLWSSVLLGMIVALTAVLQLWRLEKRADEQRLVAQEAEQRMRALSQQLVAAQEEERKSLSRELHDHVGQVLTALRMELGSIDRLGAREDRVLASAVGEARGLVDNMVRTVRDLALGLRPSMLDDLGLQPALEWLIRDFARRYGLQADLTVSGAIGGLPDPHRTCVYRVVQEALTNCVKHAQAHTVHVSLRGSDGSLRLEIEDDGVGLKADEMRSGLGLRGMEERVRDLGGTFEIQSAPFEGTRLNVRLPLTGIRTSEEATVASVIGG